MASRPTATDARFRDYVLQVGVREPEALARLREETRALPLAGMQIGPEQGALMALLVELLPVRRYLEVGVFTGYSSLAVALAMPSEGRITALDVSEEWTSVARRHWAEAGVAERIDLRLGPALDSLDRLLADGRAGTYDMAFVDADKTNYPAYYERALTLVRTGGLVCVDNTFGMGGILEPQRYSAEVATIDALNRRIHADERVTLCQLPIGDGLTLCRKR